MFAPEIHNSNEKTHSKNDYCACIGNIGMVGKRARQQPGAASLGVQLKSASPIQKGGLSSEGRPLPGGRKVDLWSLWPEMLVYALLEL
jgi:hypothetical protein